MPAITRIEPPPGQRRAAVRSALLLAAAAVLAGPPDVSSGVQAHSATSNSTYVRAGVGAPAVVFVSGLGESLQTWSEVAPALSRRTTTFVYDRPGLGRAPATARPRDAQSMAAELASLLRTARVAPPYVLVGHSLGAWVAICFMSTFPENVAGLVLVDPAFREDRLRARATPEAWAARSEALAAFTAHMTDAQRRELAALEDSGTQAHSVPALPRVPVVLLSATRINPTFPLSAVERELKMEEHHAWLARMPGARHIEVPESRHYVHRDAPTTVIDAVQWVLDTPRTP